MCCWWCVRRLLSDSFNDFYGAIQYDHHSYHTETLSNEINHLSHLMYATSTHEPKSQSTRRYVASCAYTQMLKSAQHLFLFCMFAFCLTDLLYFFIPLVQLIPIVNSVIIHNSHNFILYILNLSLDKCFHPKRSYSSYLIWSLLSSVSVQKIQLFIEKEVLYSHWAYSSSSPKRCTLSGQ